MLKIPVDFYRRICEELSPLVKTETLYLFFVILQQRMLQPGLPGDNPPEHDTRAVIRSEAGWHIWQVSRFAIGPIYQ